MQKNKGMNLRCRSSSGVRSGLKLGRVVSTWCADGQMSPSGARSVFFLCLFVFFFTPFPPTSFSGPFCKAPCVFGSLLVLCPSGVVPLTCVVHIIMKGVSAVWKTKVTSGGTNLGSRLHPQPLLSWLLHPKRRISCRSSRWQHSVNPQSLSARGRWQELIGSRRPAGSSPLVTCVLMEPQRFGLVSRISLVSCTLKPMCAYWFCFSWPASPTLLATVSRYFLFCFSFLKILFLFFLIKKNHLFSA